MCFDGSLPFHGDVENPIRLCAQVASCFENAIRYSFELLSRRFNSDHLVQHRGGNRRKLNHASECDGRHKAARDRMDTKAVLPRAPRLHDAQSATTSCMTAQSLWTS
jgi:hypothetical protein